MVKEFDLNIEKILENWEVYHAVREIIANALDEQKLTNTKDISIRKENGIWHITDYGRASTITISRRMRTMKRSLRKDLSESLVLD